MVIVLGVSNGGFDQVDGLLNMMVLCWHSRFVSRPVPHVSSPLHSHKTLLLSAAIVLATAHLPADRHPLFDPGVHHLAGDWDDVRKV